MRERIVYWTVALVFGMAAPSLVYAQQQSSCVQCHGDPQMLGADGARIVTSYADDIHTNAGLSCQDCHGGNPDPSLALDPAGAMDPGFRSNPFRGAPKRGQIPDFCGRCHSDANYMKRYRPELRVDQEQEYWTSRHGRALKAGDENVATCIDCHGVHGIRAVDDGQSPVFPKNVAQTCAKCHSDASRMKGYTLDDGRPMPTNQFALWQRSVHGRGMLDKEDLSAPTCNDCHGNHGAVPPGVQSISFVCGQCHGREAELFRASPKETGFRQHGEFLEGTGGAPCNTCHEMPKAFAQLGSVHSLSECTTCHGNHGVLRPTIAMLGPLPETPCDFCHRPIDQDVDAVPPSEADAVVDETRLKLVDQGKEQGLEGTELFDWLVDQSLQLPAHTEPAPEGSERKPRAEFLRLFEKFRIGRTTSSETASDGKTISVARVRCVECHAEGAAGSTGAQVSARYLDRIVRLSSVTAAAERALLQARRGGVETRPALDDIDQAVESSIELQVLVHGFSADPKSDFSKKYEEGMGAARKAVAAGGEALSELRSRRRGLVVALVFIGLTLIGLYVKIRQIG
jgi:hypothetical protein